MTMKKRSKSHILLVDDDSLRRTALAFLCEDSGFIVSQANSGEDALLMIDEGRAEYNLVIIDLDMTLVPVLNWQDALKRYCPDIPALVTTCFQGKAMPTGDQQRL